MSKFLLKLLLGFSLCSVQASYADTILVITRRDSGVEQLTVRELKAIFRRKILVNEQGLRWIPLNLNADHPLRRAFSQRVFEQQPEDMETYWNEQYFQGVMPPYVVASEEAVLRFVISMPNAIGYIRPCYLDTRVQVVMTLRISGALAGGNCPSSP